MAFAGRWALLPMLLSLTGCVLLDPEHKASISSSLRPGIIREADPNMIQVDVCLLERPLGDAFLNEELWSHTDQHLFDLDRKLALEENGIKVGQIIGMAPSKLHDLLKSERSCVNPRRRLIPAGDSALQFLSPLLPIAQYDVRLAGKTETLRVDQAQFALDMTATLTKDGKTRLSFVPKVQHSEPQLPLKIAPGGTHYELHTDKPHHAYPSLAFEVTLAPHQFLVVGADLEKVDRLGYRAFVRDDANPAMQRLLLLRTSRSAADPTLEDLARSNSSFAPLALQATLPAIRASRP